jgi:hypothetical protein
MYATMCTILGSIGQKNRDSTNRQSPAPIIIHQLALILMGRWSVDYGLVSASRRKEILAAMHNSIAKYIFIKHLCNT